jgi:hypothetical protein
MSPRIRHHHGHVPGPAARATRPARARVAAARSPAEIKPTVRWTFPRLADAELDGPVTDDAPQRPVAIQALRILGPLGLALFLTGGSVCGWKLSTTITPLESGMIRVLGGFLGLIFITVWPTSGD